VDVQAILDHHQVIVGVDVPHPLHLVEELHTLLLVRLYKNKKFFKFIFRIWWNF